MEEVINGNITTGAELYEKEGSKAYAICPLKKSDGSKFGKTEEGNVWLDEQTSCNFNQFFKYFG